MPIKEISPGVYVQVPVERKQPTNTAANSYNNAYLRADQETWDVAMQQAISERAVTSKTYNETKALYEHRLKDIDYRRRALLDAKERVYAGQQTATNAAMAYNNRARDKRETDRAAVVGAKGASTGGSTVDMPTTSTVYNTFGSSEEKLDFIGKVIRDRTKARLGEGADAGQVETEAAETQQELETLLDQNTADAQKLVGTPNEATGKPHDDMSAIDKVRGDTRGKFSGDAAALEAYDAAINGPGPEYQKPEGHLDWRKQGVVTRPGYIKRTGTWTAGSPGTAKYPDLPAELASQTPGEVTVAPIEEDIARLDKELASLETERSGLGDPAADTVSEAARRKDILTRTREIYNNTHMFAKGFQGRTLGSDLKSLGELVRKKGWFEQQPEDIQKLVVDHYRKTKADAKKLTKIPDPNDYTLKPELGGVIDAWSPMSNEPMDQRSLGAKLWEDRDPSFGKYGAADTRDIGDPGFLSPNERKKRQATVEAAGDLGERSPYPGDPTYGDTTIEGSTYVPTPDEGRLSAGPSTQDKPNATRDAAAAALRQELVDNADRQRQEEEKRRITEERLAVLELAPGEMPDTSSMRKGSTELPSTGRQSVEPRGAAGELPPMSTSGTGDFVLGQRSQGDQLPTGVESIPEEQRVAKPILLPSQGQFVETPPMEGRPNATESANVAVSRVELQAKKEEMDKARERREILTALFPEGVPVEYAERMRDMSPTTSMVERPAPRTVPNRDTVAVSPPMGRKVIPPPAPLVPTPRVPFVPPRPEPEVRQPRETLPEGPQFETGSIGPTKKDATKEANKLVEAHKRTDDIISATRAGATAYGVSGYREPSKVTYLTNRIQEAQEYLEKPLQLRRLTLSGVGKVASDLFKSNLVAKRNVSASWEELAMTYAGNEKDMQKAHSILLALDMQEKAKATPKE